jgi:putative ABC transport system permease protein
MRSLFQDLRFAGRSLRSARGFTAIAVATLAVAIGANTAVFSVLNGIVLRPLPFPDADRVVSLGWNWGSGPVPSLTATKFEYWRDNSRVFDGVTTFRQFAALLPDGSAQNLIDGLQISDDFFRVVGMEPALGRSFSRKNISRAAPRSRS